MRTPYNTIVWILIACANLFVCQVMAQEQAQAAKPSEEPMDEVVVTAPKPYEDETIRSGWRPTSPEDADKHLRNIYALLTELEALARRCNPDAIVTFNDQLRLRPCEDLLERLSDRTLVNYRNQCNGLVEWYGDLSTQLMQTPNWENSDQQTLRGFNYFKQNIILACDLKTVVKDFKYLDVARRDIDKIQQFVANGLNPPTGFGGFSPINNPRAPESDEDSFPQ